MNSAFQEDVSANLLFIYFVSMDTAVERIRFSCFSLDFCLPILS